MECRIRTRVREMVGELAREHQSELAAAGTLKDLEELTAEIGDEVSRQLCENELVHRGRKAAQLDRVRVPGISASRVFSRSLSSAEGSTRTR